MNTSDDIIPKLKFISRLNKGDKINVKNMYIQQNNIIDKISRSFFNIDDRTNTLMFVTNTIKKAFDLFLEHITKEKENPFDHILCQNVISDLRKSKSGLLNLKETYTEDIMFTCKIDALVEETEAKLANLEVKYPFIKERDYEYDKKDKNEEKKENEKKENKK